MNTFLHSLYSGNIPFCFIQKQDSEDVLVLTGNEKQYRNIHDIPRKTGDTDGCCIYDTISVVPFCQIRERGFKVRDGGEEILTIHISEQNMVPTDELINSLPNSKISLDQEIQYDSSEKEYCRIIENIVEKEIGNGEGANFVIPRNAKGGIESFSVAKAFSIFKSLLTNDYGTYWKFIFFDTNRFFIGSTPERHLFVKDGRVKMNPISGTFRKDKKFAKRADFKKELLKFLTNQKEINELFMVVDEELKMMAKMCENGGAIVGPLLKEMSQLIHSEYLLSGESDGDIFDLFTDSMFAATVVGSPVENACNIIAKYSSSSRRYYGSALMLVGRDEKGHDFLDSPITIRTLEIDLQGKIHFSVGATLVKDSIAKEEMEETRAKSGAILASFAAKTDGDVGQPLLTRLYNDDEIIETMVQRNQNLSNFWFFKQESRGLVNNSGKKVSITIIHNEDDFVYMLRHMFSSMGMRPTIVRFSNYDIKRDTGDITLLGPGPGNPNDIENNKIGINRQIARKLLQLKRRSLFICLGHQILCSTLGFEVERKERPLQGSQVKINLFGTEERVGFYNTFAPINSSVESNLEVALLPESAEMVAIRGEHFVGYQFHPESLLTKNGYVILRDTVNYLLG